MHSLRVIGSGCEGRPRPHETRGPTDYAVMAQSDGKRRGDAPLDEELNGGRKVTACIRDQLLSPTNSKSQQKCFENVFLYVRACLQDVENELRMN